MIAERARGIDRVEAGRVAREETPSGALGLDRFPDFRALVQGKIVIPTMSPGKSAGTGHTKRLRPSVPCGDHFASRRRVR
jgi:hypothetical protein